MIALDLTAHYLVYLLRQFDVLPLPNLSAPCTLAGSGILGEEAAALGGQQARGQPAHSRAARREAMQQLRRPGSDQGNCSVRKGFSSAKLRCDTSLPCKAALHEAQPHKIHTHQPRLKLHRVLLHESHHTLFTFICGPVLQTCHGRCLCTIRDLEA